ncbi:MAG: EamA family transporter [Microbacteriaceae bacterium]|nr:EamA family transporter [Microbacteriaceae bacterium]
MTGRGALLYAVLAIAWGVPYLFIKIAVEELDPTFVVFARCALGAVVLLPLALARKQVLPVLRRWRPLLIFTLFELVLAQFFLTTAETRLPSSTAGLLLAAVPLVALVVVFFFGRPERLSAGNWLGIVLGMAGVAAIVGLDVGGSNLLAVAQVGVVAVSYAVGPAIMARWLSDLPGVGVVAVSLGITGLVFVPVVTAFGGWPTEVPSAAAIWSIVGLAVLCSALAFVVMFTLVAEIGPVRMSTITYVNPAIAVLAGALVLGERITVWTVVGFALVLAGSYLVTRKAAARATVPIDESVEAPGRPAG